MQDPDKCRCEGAGGIFRFGEGIAAGADLQKQSARGELLVVGRAAQAERTRHAERVGAQVLLNGFGKRQIAHPVIAARPFFIRTDQHHQLRAGLPVIECDRTELCTVTADQ